MSHFVEPLGDIGGVDDDAAGFHVGRLETELFEQAFHDRVETPRADVLRRLVDPVCIIGKRLDRVGLESQLDPLGLEQGLVLPGERVFRLRQDADEVRLGQVLQFHADREAALELRHQVARLGAVERAGGDEQDVVGLDEAVARLHGRAFDDRQQVALDPLPGDVGAVGVFAGDDLVDLVDEDDPGVLGQRDRLGLHLVLVDQRVDFLLEEDFPRLDDGHLAAGLVLGEDFLEHPLKIDVHLLHAGAAEHHRHDLVFGGQLDSPLVELSGGEHRAEFFSCPLVAFGGRGAVCGIERRRGHEQVEQALLRPALRFLLHPRSFGFADQADGVFNEFADHAFHVAAVVADLRVLGGFDLDERRAGELRQPARDLGLPDAGRPDHHDVLGRDLGAHLLAELLPAPAIAHGDGHRAFGLVLPDNVAVQLGNDPARRQVSHSNSSTVMFVLV